MNMISDGERDEVDSLDFKRNVGVRFLLWCHATTNLEKEEEFVYD